MTERKLSKWANLLLIFFALTLAGCVTARSVYEQCTEYESVANWQKFLRDYPDSDLSGSARQRLKAVQCLDDYIAAWEAFQKERSPSDYQDYLEKTVRSYRKKPGFYVSSMFLESACDSSAYPYFKHFFAIHPDYADSLKMASSNFGVSRQELEPILAFLEWLPISDRPSMQALRSYINEHPESSCTSLAQELLAWDSALKQDTISSYESFLSSYGDSDHRNDANAAILRLKGKSIEHVSIELTDKPQAMFGGLTISGWLPLSNRAGKLEVDKPRLIIPAKGHVFLIADLIIKPDEEMKVDIGKNILLSMADGTTLTPYVKVSIPYVGTSWASADSVSITDTLDPRTQHSVSCLFIISRAKIEGAKVSIWGRESGGLEKLDRDISGKAALK